MANMGTLKMRQPLPDRRRSWTQKVVSDGQTVYLCVGEYDDGRPGEIFVDVAKQGTFLRGVMGALARTVSIALQCGADVAVVVHSLRGANYPPNGRVEGSDAVAGCLSVTDWIAAELAARYMAPAHALTNGQVVGEGDAALLDPEEDMPPYWTGGLCEPEDEAA